MSWPLDPWWATLAPGSETALAFIKLDRVASTIEWKELPAADVQRRRAQFVSGVEQIAEEYGAVQPLHWQGDGVLLVLPCRDADELLRAWRAAQALWQRQTLDLNLPTRIALHAALDVAWNADTGKLAHPAIDTCGHLEHAAPEKALAITEDVALALPDAEHHRLGWLGVTRRDEVSAYVYPAGAAERRRPEAFTVEAASQLWRRFREHAHSPVLRQLRYAGLELSKKEPPSLDVLKVFVAPRVTLRPRFDRDFDLPSDGPDSTTLAAPDGARRRRAVVARREPTEPSLALVEALRRTRMLVVLGEPGAGKTTLLRWLAVLAAGGRLTLARATGLAERLLPLPVSVGRLAEIRRAAGGGLSVFDALARYFEERSLGTRDELVDGLRSALDAGTCLVLLDGLDEVAVADRRTVAEWLESFVASVPLNRFVVTSRPAGYSRFALPGGLEVVLRPFDDAAVEHYVAAFQRAYLAWETQADQPRLAEQHTRDFLEALSHSPRLRDLARNPFLLAVLALIHRAEGRLPRHRVQAYQVCARTLCETWSSARRLVARPSQPDIAYEAEALPVLGALAIAMQAEHPDGLAPERWVLRVLSSALIERRDTPVDQAASSARAFLQRAGQDTGLLVERAPGQWGFLHLTFQEFFVAAGLHAQERFEPEAFRHLFDPRWEEVLRLGIGHLALIQGRPEAARRSVRRVLDYRLEGPSAWLTLLLKKQVPLAALLATEAGDTLPPADMQAVAEAFADWLLAAPDFFLYGGYGRRHVEEVRESTFADALAKALSARIKDRRVDPDTLAWLTRRLRHKHLAAALLSALDADPPGFHDEVLHLVGHLSVEQAVPALIAQVEAGDTGALSILADIGAPAGLKVVYKELSNVSERRRQSAAEALGRVDTPTAREALRSALNDAQAPVRIRAALSLLPLEPEHALPVLERDLARTEVRTLPSWFPRPVIAPARAALVAALDSECVAVRTIAGRLLVASADHSIVSAMFPHLVEGDAIVRKAVLDAIAHAGFAPTVEPIAACLDAMEPDVRCAAAAALQRIHARSAAPALRGALADDVPEVRLAAAAALAGLGFRDCEDVLVDLLSHDDPRQRRAAAVALGEVGTAACVPALLERLGKTDSSGSQARDDVQRVVVEALGKLAAVEAVVPLLALHAGALSYGLREDVQLALWRISEAVDVTPLPPA